MLHSSAKCSSVFIKNLPCRSIAYRILAPCQSRVSPTFILVSQLSAHNHCIIVVPSTAVDCHPHSTRAQFNSSFICCITINQTHLSFSTACVHCTVHIDDAKLSIQHMAVIMFVTYHSNGCQHHSNDRSQWKSYNCSLKDLFRFQCMIFVISPTTLSLVHTEIHRNKEMAVVIR